mmetsp:Transcript_28168/g.47277  ORF Transcript_28168/g.47277 Transcript_28168/m.47277 type:complete len:334 (-) Transcript_28168:104-1105(-)
MSVSIHIDTNVRRSQDSLTSASPLSSPPASIDSSHAPVQFHVPVATVKFGRPVVECDSVIVYEGTMSKKRVLIKRNQRKIFSSPDLYGAYIKRLENEIALSSVLDHPGILRCIGLCTESLQAFLILKHTTGFSLMSRRDDKQKLPTVSQVIALSLQLAHVIQYLHDRRICHGDLNPYNILIDRKWSTLKLIDLGCASYVSTEGFVLSSTVGSFRWSSPENLRREAYGLPTDIFSFGVLLWQLVTGKTPYFSLTAAEVEHGVAYSGKRPSALKVCNTCPPELVSLVQSCWEEDPALRPAIADVIVQLQRMVLLHPSLFHHMPTDGRTGGSCLLM